MSDVNTSFGVLAREMRMRRKQLERGDGTELHRIVPELWDYVERLAEEMDRAALAEMGIYPTNLLDPAPPVRHPDS